MRKIKKVLFPTMLIKVACTVFAHSAYAVASIGDAPIMVSGGTMVCTGVQKNTLDKTHYRLVNFNEQAAI